MTVVPVRLRVGCHVTTVGELQLDENDPDAAYPALADVLEAAAIDLRDPWGPHLACCGHRLAAHRRFDGVCTDETGPDQACPCVSGPLRPALKRPDG